MKKIVTIIFSIILVCILFSCVSPPTIDKPYRPMGRIPNAVVIDTIETTLVLGLTYGYRSNNQQISEFFYVEFLRTAKEKYGDNVDIVDITWVFIEDNITSFTWKSFSDAKFKYLGRGNVVSINQYIGIEDALEHAAKEAIKNIPANSTIAIIYITAHDEAAINFIANELEFIWVKEGYRIVNRADLDLLRQEQNFQLSGEVDDNSAVSIGKFLGANIIVTGSIDGNINLRRLRLRLLDAETGQVIGVASEQL
jgi:hypothetical protein